MATPLKKHLLISFYGTNYVLGSLSFNIGKGEFSYHLAYSRTRPCFRNHKTAKCFMPYDHITFHQNMLNLKNSDDKIVEQHSYQSGQLIAGTDYITPLYIETIKLSKEESCLPIEGDFSFWQRAIRENLLTVEAHGFFSIIFLLVPTKMTTIQALECMWHDLRNEVGVITNRTYLRHLCDGHHHASRMNVWTDYDILMLSSSYCQFSSDIPNNIKSYRIPNYIHTQEGLKELIARRQADKIVELFLELIEARIRFLDHDI